ncbi:MAG: tryptophan--tRNA ligase [Candidatus Harrisonbacteria bacterium]|nr:tryptophan--tRNA ligase [Candidatus Harrisonbacteria bacterium]
MSKPILISGTQPDGRLHLGNYLGAIKNWVELQNSEKYECYFIIVDYHSLTVDFNPTEKKEEVLGVVRAYLAAGIDPKKSKIFVQSRIPECTELAWILNTITPLGELERMTQFKEKSENKESVNTGLLTYPILMAADILLYDARFVPVGEDQLQHLELTRTLARKFNNKFGKTFIEPRAILSKASRVMSLDNPSKKMSKSHPETCLFLDDPPKDIEFKIKRAVTDSGSEVKFDLEKKPGVSNLLLIYEALSGITIPKLEKKYAGKGYGQFKSNLAEVAIKTLATFRESKFSDKKLKSILTNGAEKAKKIASSKMQVIKNRLGLRV